MCSVCKCKIVTWRFFMAQLKYKILNLTWNERKMDDWGSSLLMLQQRRSQAISTCCSMTQIEDYKDMVSYTDLWDLPHRTRLRLIGMLIALQTFLPDNRVPSQRFCHFYSIVWLLTMLSRVELLQSLLPLCILPKALKDKSIPNNTYILSPCLAIYMWLLLDCCISAASLMMGLFCTSLHI